MDLEESIQDSECQLAEDLQFEQCPSLPKPDRMQRLLISHVVKKMGDYINKFQSIDPDNICRIAGPLHSQMTSLAFIQTCHLFIETLLPMNSFCQYDHIIKAYLLACPITTLVLNEHGENLLHASVYAYTGLPSHIQRHHSIIQDIIAAYNSSYNSIPAHQRLLSLKVDCTDQRPHHSALLPANPCDRASSGRCGCGDQYNRPNHPALILNDLGMSPLHILIKESSSLPTPLVRYLIQSCPEAVKQPTSAGLYPLHLLVQRRDFMNHIDCLSMLIEAFPQILSHTVTTAHIRLSLDNTPARKIVNECNPFDVIMTYGDENVKHAVEVILEKIFKDYDNKSIRKQLTRGWRHLLIR